MVSVTQTPLPGEVPAVGPMLQAGSARKGLSAFFLAGLISAFLGAILPAWRHHIQPDYLLIAAYFLLQNLGMLLGPLVSAPLLRSRGLGVVLAAGAGLAACGFLLLAFSSRRRRLVEARRAAAHRIRGRNPADRRLPWSRPRVRNAPRATLNLGGRCSGLAA